MLLFGKKMANDLGRLAQGVGTRMKTGTNTIFFIHPSKIPKNKKVTYCRIVSPIRPLKLEVHRMRVTVEGDHLDYDSNTSAVPAQLYTVKLYLNSTISTLGARYMTINIKDFFYGTPMELPDYEYAQLSIELIPQEIIDPYHLIKLTVNNKVYFVI